MSTSVIDRDVDVDQDPAGKRPNHSSNFHVILWDDEDHTATYVIKMLQELFGYEPEQAYELMEEVCEEGKAAVYTGPRHEAQLRRDKIHAYGKDKTVAECAGSMSATIEQAP